MYLLGTALSVFESTCRTFPRHPVVDALDQQINGAKTPGEQKRIPFCAFEGREISFFKLLSCFNATTLERHFGAQS
jgi:hypothetical protein